MPPALLRAFLVVLITAHSSSYAQDSLGAIPKAPTTAISAVSEIGHWRGLARSQDGSKAFEYTIQIDKIRSIGGPDSYLAYYRDTRLGKWTTWVTSTLLAGSLEIAFWDLAPDGGASTVSELPYVGIRFGDDGTPGMSMRIGTEKFRGVATKLPLTLERQTYRTSSVFEKRTYLLISLDRATILAIRFSKPNRAEIYGYLDGKLMFGGKFGHGPKSASQIDFTEAGVEQTRNTLAFSNLKDSEGRPQALSIDLESVANLNPILVADQYFQSRKSATITIETNLGPTRAWFVLASTAWIFPKTWDPPFSEFALWTHQLRMSPRTGNH